MSWLETFGSQQLVGIVGVLAFLVGDLRQRMTKCESVIFISNPKLKVK